MYKKLEGLRASVQGDGLVFRLSKISGKSCAEEFGVVGQQVFMDNEALLDLADDNRCELRFCCTDLGQLVCTGDGATIPTRYEVWAATCLASRQSSF